MGSKNGGRYMYTGGRNSEVVVNLGFIAFALKTPNNGLFLLKKVFKKYYVRPA
jgi:hypothetical protein